MDSDDKILKGTTTIGLACSDGVVLLTDRRASMGTFIASRKAKKVYKVNDYIGATIAGSVGDAEAIVRLIQAEAALYEMNNRERMSTKAAANLIANVLQGSKYYPYMIQVLIGGYDKKSSIYTLDPLGGLIEEDMASTGSGSPVAYGVLELDYSLQNTVKENIPVAVRAMLSALQRDCATGDGLSLVTITKDGFKEYGEDEVDDYIKKVSKKSK
ncbi:MAG: archaeal proteasome endopeptidase complex subunit beta [Candidatus Altiarchaeia archaeon]